MFLGFMVLGSSVSWSRLRARKALAGGRRDPWGRPGEERPEGKLEHADPDEKALWGVTRELRALEARAEGERLDLLEI